MNTAEILIGIISIASIVMAIIALKTTPKNNTH